MKQLFIIRHAKSSWSNPNLKDYDRPLNKRGKSDAPLMGKVIAEMGYVPDWIISSPAKRAEATAEIIANCTLYSKEIEWNETIYESSSRNLLRIINETADKHNTLFIIGHNPSFAHLAEILSGNIFGNLPTCGVVGLQFDFDSWSLISSNTGMVFLHDYPKNHK